MRNAFLLFILSIFLFSIGSLIWKSLLEAKTKPTENNTDLRVEKLLKGDETSKLQLEEIPREYSVKYNIKNEIEQPQQIQPQVQELQKIREEIRPRESEEKSQQIIQQNDVRDYLKNPENIKLKQVSQEQIQAINAELVKKYGNNPDAEVSEEDLQKIIEQFMTVQNR